MNRILILKLNPIEDIIYTLPFLNTLKTNYSRSTVVWLVSAHCQELLEEHSALNELIAYKRKKTVFSRLKELISFVKELRNEQFDLVIDLEGGLKGYFFSLFVKANRKTIQTTYPLITKLGPYSQIIPRKNTSSNKLEQLKQLANTLNITEKKISYLIEISSADKEQTEYLLMQNGIKKDDKLIILCPITKKNGSKGCSIDYFNQLIKTAYAQALVPLVIASKADKAYLKDIQGSLILTDISLKQKCYLIRKAIFLIGNDNEWIDLSLALDTKTILVAKQIGRSERKTFPLLQHQPNADYKNIFPS